jgi:hypothetical protein
MALIDVPKLAMSLWRAARHADAALHRSQPPLALLDRPRFVHVPRDGILGRDEALARYWRLRPAKASPGAVDPY